MYGGQRTQAASGVAGWANFRLCFKSGSNFILFLFFVFNFIHFNISLHSA